MVNRKRITKLQKLLSHYDCFANLIGCQANCTHDVVSALCSAVSKVLSFSLFSLALYKRFQNFFPHLYLSNTTKAFQMPFAFEKECLNT